MNSLPTINNDNCQQVIDALVLSIDDDEFIKCYEGKCVPNPIESSLWLNAYNRWLKGQGVSDEDIYQNAMDVIDTLCEYYREIKITEQTEEYYRMMQNRRVEICAKIYMAYEKVLNAEPHACQSDCSSSS